MDQVEVKDTGSSYGGYTYAGHSNLNNFDKFTRDPFDSVYESPGWKRAQRQQASRQSRGPMTIEGDLVARSVDDGRGSAYAVGDIVVHLKFGNGQSGRYRGQQADHRFRRGGTEEGDRELC